MQFDKIVVTTDFSEDSFAAIDIAAYEAKMRGSSVVLLTIVEDWNPPEVLLRQVPNPESISAYRDDLLKSAKERLEEVAKEKFHEISVESLAILSDKPVAEEICRIAEEKKGNLIIISSHGRGAIGKFFLGSTVEKVIRMAVSPVLVIPKK